jgi:hypothetical protein
MTVGQSKEVVDNIVKNELMPLCNAERINRQKIRTCLLKILDYGYGEHLLILIMKEYYKGTYNVKYANIVKNIIIPLMKKESSENTSKENVLGYNVKVKISLKPDPESDFNIRYVFGHEHKEKIRKLLKEDTNE